MTSLSASDVNLLTNGGCLLLAIELRKRFGYDVVVLMEPVGILEIGDHYRLADLLLLSSDVGAEMAVNSHMTDEHPSDWDKDRLLAFARCPRLDGLLSYNYLKSCNLCDLADWEISHAFAVDASGVAIDAYGRRDKSDALASLLEESENDSPSLFAVWDYQDLEALDPKTICGLSDQRWLEFNIAVDRILSSSAALFAPIK